MQHLMHGGRRRVTFSAQRQTADVVHMAMPVDAWVMTSPSKARATQPQASERPKMRLLRAQALV